MLYSGREKGGSMVLALWLLPGATISHMRAQEELRNKNVEEKQITGKQKKMKEN